MTDLLKEAIADAKAVREVALANAKLALEEAFTPRIQSMIATKLSEEAESDEEMTEGDDEWYMEGENGEDTMEEGEDEEMPVEEGDDEEAPSMEEGDDEEPMEEAEDEEMPVEEGDEEEAPVEEGDDEEIDEDLMEIIRQLEEELDSSEIGTGDNKQPSKSASDDHTQDKKEKLVQLVEEEEDEDASTVEEGDDEDVDIQEILRALREEDEEEAPVEEGDEEEAPVEEGEDETAEMEEKVNEAYAVIQFLREKLNEVNLLNSKLLFSNKLFRSYSLSESQKITVIENFDRAGSLREVKLVYATLAESFKGRSMKTPKSTKKTSLKEAFASKPQASTRPSKKILTESNQVADRFKKLAGLL
jgi:hypothetical protein